MTDEELDAMKYKVCCPLCDNFKCARGTEKCEAELWKKWRMKQMANELSVEEAIELLKEKRMEINYQVNGTTQFSRALDMAIEALERQTCDTPRNNLAESSQNIELRRFDTN